MKSRKKNKLYMFDKGSFCVLSTMHKFASIVVFYMGLQGTFGLRE